MSTPQRRLTLRTLAVGATMAGLLAAATAGTVGATPPAAAGRPTIFMKVHDARPVRGGGSVQLTYHGGVAGSGVVTGIDKVFLVYWGSQWGTSGSNDPSGEVGIQNGFFGNVGGSPWNKSVTQYCQGVATGTVTCPSGSDFATNPSNVLGTRWFDSATAAPSHPSQSQLAAEAVKAATHFGNPTNTAVQYVINTASGNNSSGFGTQYCAWHSSTSTSAGNIAYTNMPYITDAGASCGANFNNLGVNAGITIVGGHEFAETETDIFPNGGWLDKNGAENGDKCAWISSGQGASANVTLTGGASYPVQSLWSNASNANKGGCVLSF